VSERGPDFEAIVGSDLESAERDRLLRVHEALVAAGPPPQATAMASAPSTAWPEPLRVRPVAPGRRRGTLVALAAALGVLVFAVGAVVGNAWDEPGTFKTITMTGTPTAEGATASLELFDLDDAGNWPMEIRVSGLAPAASGRPFELWLTRGGEPAALCGSFLVAPDGTAVVPMNAPYRLDGFDGWVVVEEGSQAPLLTT
jgi:hypothetical protein